MANRSKLHYTPSRLNLPDLVKSDFVCLFKFRGHSVCSFWLPSNDYHPIDRFVGCHVERQDSACDSVFSDRSFIRSVNDRVLNSETTCSHTADGSHPSGMFLR